MISILVCYIYTISSHHHLTLELVVNVLPDRTLGRHGHHAARHTSDTEGRSDVDPTVVAGRSDSLVHILWILLNLRLHAHITLALWINGLHLIKLHFVIYALCLLRCDLSVTTHSLHDIWFHIIAISRHQVWISSLWAVATIVIVIFDLTWKLLLNLNLWRYFHISVLAHKKLLIGHACAVAAAAIVALLGCS